MANKLTLTWVIWERRTQQHLVVCWPTPNNIERHSFQRWSLHHLIATTCFTVSSRKALLLIWRNYEGSPNELHVADSRTALLNPVSHLMVNGLYLYSTFLVFQPLKALLQHKSAFTHSHTFTLGAGGFSTKTKPAHQELIHTHSHTNGIPEHTGDRTTNLLISWWPALPTELQLPLTCLNRETHSAALQTEAMRHNAENHRSLSHWVCASS